jgi:hypothetical protein
MRDDDVSVWPDRFLWWLCSLLLKVRNKSRSLQSFWIPSPPITRTWSLRYVPELATFSGNSWAERIKIAPYRHTSRRCFVCPSSLDRSTRLIYLIAVMAISQVIQVIGILLLSARPLLG